MSTGTAATDFYVTGGTMLPDAASYVVRAADDELFRTLANGEYCYVLTTRQMGKSSLMARTAARLAAAGIRSAQVTLETIRETGAAPRADEFLYAVANKIHQGLGLPPSLKAWWQDRSLLTSTARFHGYLTELLLGSVDGPIVVSIDEIDSTIGLPFADDFYAAIRACHNGRATQPALRRLTFVLIGTATPAQLIADPTRTPFNVGRGIELTDFTAAEAQPLAAAFRGTDKERRAALDRILYWTGGHPYLTQALCQAVATRAAADRGVVDAEVERCFFRPEAAREEKNLKFVRSRLKEGHRDLGAVLRTYRRVLAGKVVADTPASAVHAALKLAGVVRVDADGCLRPRNRIYERVFGPAWVQRELPRNRTRMMAIASMVALVVAAGSLVAALRQAERARQAHLQAVVAERLITSDLAGLVTLARENSERWDEVPIILSDEFLRSVNPKLFAEVPWSNGSPDPGGLLMVIERAYRVLVSSRPLFGAMSLALQELSMRSDDPSVRARALSLGPALRTEFISYHEETTPGFVRPPARADGDTLNEWLALPAGQFVMGSTNGDSDERPTHRVQLSAFFMQRHEVTNEEYRRFDPNQDFPPDEAKHPVSKVSSYEAAGYAAWLGASLPTEAQWEYAARGTGPTSGRKYPWGESEPDEARAVFDTKRPAPVSSRPSGRTPEGLDDMAGNVWEWCRDWYSSYGEANALDPIGPIAGDAEETWRSRLRVLRGGSFLNAANDLRAANRDRYLPDVELNHFGFRLVLSESR